MSECLVDITRILFLIYGPNALGLSCVCMCKPVRVHSQSVNSSGSVVIMSDLTSTLAGLRCLCVPAYFYSETMAVAFTNIR